jgi:Secretion system C-terminal sorting domain
MTMRFFMTFMLLLGSMATLQAQRPIFTDCPMTGTAEVCGFGRSSGYMCRGGVRLQTTIYDPCLHRGEPQLQYRIWFDLNADGRADSVLMSGDPKAWPIVQRVVGDGLLVLTIQSPFDATIPFGVMHRIEWSICNACGRWAFCRYGFVLRDCIAPSVVCNDVSVNIMQTGMVNVPLQTLLRNANDDCSPTAQLRFGIRKAGEGQGFPNNTTEVTFTCKETGPQAVEIWGKDQLNNAAFCKATIIVQDPNSSCKNFGDGASERSTSNSPISIASVWPNPIQDVLHVSLDLPLAGTVNLTLFDMDGRVLQEQNMTATAGTQTLDWPILSSMPNGLVLLRITAQEKTAVHRMLVLN